MIVFDLQCAATHVFEAWFASSSAYEEQRAAGAIACPVCGDVEVTKAVMAPSVATGAGDAAPPAAIKAALAALAGAQAKALEGSRWVGRRFAEEARRMHDGELAHAPIHGEATRSEADALMSDGVKVAPLPLRVRPPDTLN